VPTDPRILLTGGTGFFGRSLLRVWKSRAAVGCNPPRVTVLTRSPESFAARHPEFGNEAWLDYVQADVCVAESLPRAKKFTHVLHAATESTLGPKFTDMQRFEDIVTGTRNMLEFAVACGAKRFLLTSSGGVYGPQPEAMERMPEGYLGMPDPLDPRSAYGIAKRASEHLCALFTQQFGIDAVIARCFAFVGQDLPIDAHFAIGNFIRDALFGESVVVAGDGTQVRTYMDQRDLAHWLLTLLDSGLAGRAYNVGSDEPIAVGEVAKLVRDVLAPDKRVQFLGRSEALSVRNRYVPDVQRAKVELGLRVTIPLSRAIRDAADAVLAARGAGK
jgi:UDP-glucuronate decarboxylase